MYAYENYIQVRSAEINLKTCNIGIASTFFQSCCVSSSDRNLSRTHLEYIGQVAEIIAMDYDKFELYVLCYLWIQANTMQAWATMKRDDYSFTLIKFNQVINRIQKTLSCFMYIYNRYFLQTKWTNQNGRLFSIGNHGGQELLQSQRLYRI